MPSPPALPGTRPLHAVLDTNVVMALWHFRDPALAALQDAIGAGLLRLLTREDCLAELQRVLAYPQFGLASEAQAEHLKSYRAACSIAAAPAPDGPVLPQCRDGDDQKFVELAWQTGAQLLVTRDKLLLRLARRAPLRDRMLILTPERLCAALAPAQVAPGPAVETP